MNMSIRRILRDKKGIAEALGVTIIVMTLLVAVGGVVANYAILSKQAGALSSLSVEVTNRAAAYASALNADLGTPQVPSTARECSTTTQVCTQIVNVTTGADQVTLRVQADAVYAFGTAVTQDVTLYATEVTHVTGMDADGGYVWGRTGDGPRFRVWGLSDGEPVEVSDDALDPTAGNRWVTVDDRAGIDSTGALWVWGKNNIGQAGVGSTSTTPVAPKKVGSNFRYVVTDDDRGYAIDRDGRLWVWGKNNAGQLGLGHTTNVTSPTKVSALASVRFVDVAIGKNNAIALTSDGLLRVAGAAQAGFSDTSGTSWRQLTPGTRYTDIAASASDGTLALITTAGAIVQNGATLPSPSGVKFTTVAKGGTAGYAIAMNGDLYSWGQGAAGQLGQGGVTSSTAVVKVTGAPRVIDVEGSKTGALAVTATGQLYYAGTIQLPYVGAGNVKSSSTFVKLLNGSVYRGVAGNAGDESFAVLDQDGNLLSVGAGTPGLWPITWEGGNDQLIRMPTPAGFGG